MRRYIDTDKLKEFYKPYAERKLSVPVDVILLNIDDMPTEDVQEVRRGQWIRTGEDGYCSICNCDMPMYKEDWEWRYLETPYCPNCGAKMREKKNECDDCFIPMFYNLEDDDSICRDCEVGE